MTDDPYPFSGKILEAYYTNPLLDSVSIIWSDGKTAHEYNVVADESDHQFQALLSEFSHDDLDECTRNRNEIGRQAFREAFNNYAKKNDLLISAEEQLASLDILFDFDLENDKHKEELFKLKLKIFDQDVVQKSKAIKKKTDVRKSETPLEAIVLYKSFLK